MPISLSCQIMFAYLQLHPDGFWLMTFIFVELKTLFTLFHEKAQISMHIKLDP